MRRMALPRALSVAFAFVGSAAAGVAFQNCTGAGFGASQASSVDLPLSHPSTEAAVVGNRETLQILDRRGIEATLKRAFFPGPTDPSRINTVNYYVDATIGRAQYAFGRSCDPLATGTLDDCVGLIGNMDVAFDARTSSLREGARIKACRRLIAHEWLATVAADSFSGGTMSPPNDASLTAALRAFYPDLDGEDLERALVPLRALVAKASSESLVARWQLVLMSVCESAGWQAL